MMEMILRRVIFTRDAGLVDCRKNKQAYGDFLP